MGKLYAIIKYDLKAALGGAMAILPLAPVLVAFLLGYSFLGDIMKSGAITPFSVAIVFEGDSMVSSMMSSALKTMSIISDTIEADEDEALRLLETGEVASVIKIPDGLIDALIYNTAAEIELWGSADYPVESSLVLGLTEGISKAVTDAQTTVYAFYDTARQYYETDAEFYKAYEGFARDILFDVLQRGRFVQGAESEYDYAAQLVSVILFISASFGAAVVAMNSADQYADGSYSRMRLAGVGGGLYTFAKLCETAIFCALTVIPLFAVSGAMGLFDGASLWKAFVSALLSAYTLFAIFQTAAGYLKNSQFTALASFAVMLALLFIGGGIYPLYLMGRVFSVIGAYTPANIGLGTVIWSFGGQFPAVALVYAAGATAALFLPRAVSGR